MQRFTLPLIIIGSVLLAALLTYVTLSTISFDPRPGAATGSVPVSATPTTQALPPFRRIDVAGTAEVTLVQGDQESVTSVAGDAGAYTAARVRDGTLHLESSGNAPWWNWLLDRGSGRTPRITVVFRQLEAIAAAGTVKVTVDGLRTPRLEISGAGGTSIEVGGLAADTLAVSGAGALRARMAGTVTTQTVSISGAGEYRAADLVSRDATVTVAGAGQVVVHATHRLQASISGAGEIEYLGDPEVTERISGIGHVRRYGKGAAPTSPRAAGT